MGDADMRLRAQPAECCMNVNGTVVLRTQNHQAPHPAFPQGNRISSRPCERRDPSPLAIKVKEDLCSSAETRVRAAAMSAIAPTLGSLRSQGRPAESLCEATIASARGSSERHAGLTAIESRMLSYGHRRHCRIELHDFQLKPLSLTHENARRLDWSNRRAL